MIITLIMFFALFIIFYKKCNDEYSEEIDILINKNRMFIYGIFAVFILAFHHYVPINLDNLSFLQHNSSFYSECIDPVTSFSPFSLFLYSGEWCVDGFIFLSGFGLVYSYINSKDLKYFYKKRFNKIIFGYLCTSIFIGLIKEWDIYTYLYNISCLNFLSGHVYDFMWFANAIVLFYLLFPLLFELVKKIKHRWWIIILICILLYLPLINSNGYLYLLIRLFVTRIPAFILGIYLAYYHLNIKKIKINKKIIISMFIFYIFILALDMVLKSNALTGNINDRLRRPLLLNGIIFIFIVSGLNSINVINKYIFKYFSIIGKYSFQIYLYQDIIAYSFLKYNIKSMIPNGIIYNYLFLYCFILFLIIMIYLEKKLKEGVRKSASRTF